MEEEGLCQRPPLVFSLRSRFESPEARAPLSTTRRPEALEPRRELRDGSEGGAEVLLFGPRPHGGILTSPPGPRRGLWRPRRAGSMMPWGTPAPGGGRADSPGRRALEGARWVHFPGRRGAPGGLGLSPPSGGRKGGRYANAVRRGPGGSHHGPPGPSSAPWASLLGGWPWAPPGALGAGLVLAAYGGPGLALLLTGGLGHGAAEAAALAYLSSPGNVALAALGSLLLLSSPRRRRG